MEPVTPPESATVRALPRALRAIVSYIKANPALVVTSTGTLLNALIMLGLRLSGGKVVAVNAIVGVIVGLIIRQNVSPTYRQEERRNR